MKNDGRRQDGRDENERMAALRQRVVARLLGAEKTGEKEEPLEAQRRVVSRLARALRDERRRGQAGHWTYDLNRHIALMQAYRTEHAILRASTRKAHTKRSGT